MLNHLEVTFEGDHVLVRADGEKDYEFQERLSARVSRVCEKHQCFNVLGIGNTTRPFEVVECYEQPRVFRDNGIDERYRIAWVELNHDVLDVIELTASILANRDLPGLLFPTVDAAKEWLFKDDSTQ